MKNAGAIMFVALVVLLLLQTAALTEAACDPTELTPCLTAGRPGTVPPPECCVKLKEQEPCLCGYAKNPGLIKYVNSPYARNVFLGCNLPFPQC